MTKKRIDVMYLSLFFLWVLVSVVSPRVLISAFVAKTRNNSFRHRLQRPATSDSSSLMSHPLSALDHLIWTCQHHGIQIISRATAPTSTQRPIRALLLRNHPDASLHLCIIPEKSKLDALKVQAILNTTDAAAIKILTNEEAISLTGFSQHLMPPLGLISAISQTLVDESLLKGTHLYCPAGYSSWRCLVGVDTLLSLDHVMAVDLIVSSTDDYSTTSILSFPKDSPPSKNAVIYPKPFFPGEPPPTHISRLVLDNAELSSPLESVWITLACRLGPRISQQSSELVEFSIHPLCSDERMHPKLQNKGLQPPPRSEEDLEFPWRSPHDGEDMRVRLSIGKALLQRLGKERGQATIKSLREDASVFVEAKTNVLNKSSLRLWVEERTLELVAYQCRPLTGDNEAKEATARPEPAQSPALNSIQLKDCWKFGGDALAEPSVTIVDDFESVATFHACLANVIQKAENNEFNINFYCVESGAMVGMDCEWRPDDFIKAGEYQQILLLQVCFYPMKQIFLLDLMALLRPLLGQNEELNDIEKEVSAALNDLFSSPRLVKVGYQLVSDLQRMASSYPHMDCFRKVESVLEVSTLVKRILHVTKQKRTRNITMSLARLVHHYTGKRMDKANQVSDWAFRPLSEEQIHYCALDAAIAPLLVKQALKRVGAKIDGNVPIITDDRLSKGIYSWRFNLLQEEPSDRDIQNSKAVRLVGKEWIVSDSWISGSSDG